MIAEIWKPIPGYDAKYEASNLGRIRSWAHARCYFTKTKTGEACMLKPQIKTKRKVMMVHLSNGDTTKWANVHALVLEAFYGPRPPRMKACHIDGDCQNNRLDNLKWATQSENMIDAIIAGTLHQSATLTPAQVLEIMQNNSHPNQLAEIYGVTPPCIYNIKAGRSWGWLTGKQKE